MYIVRGYIIKKSTPPRKKRAQMPGIKAPEEKKKDQEHTELEFWLAIGSPYLSSAKSYLAAAS